MLIYTNLTKFFTEFNMQHSHEFIALCSEVKTRVRETSPDEVEKSLNAGKVDYLIDVRDADEYQAGHLPKAHHLSKGWIEAKIHQLVDNKNANIVLYCGGGNRSVLAADNLQKMGYKNILSMTSGFKGWVAQGKPVNK